MLKAGDNPAQGVKILAAGAAAGALVKFAAESALRLIPDIAQWGAYAGKAIIYVGTNVSPALLGVGYIVGLNAGAVVLLGGVIAWNIGIPIYSTFFLDGNPDLAAAVAGASAVDAAGMIRAAQIRYLGVGAMLIGGVWTLFSIRKSILSGVRSGLAATRANVGAVVAQSERDIPMKYVLIGIVAFTLPLAALYQAIVGPARRGRDDDGHHDRRRLRVLLGVRLPRRTRRLVKQSRIRHHDLHHPVCGAGAGCAAGTRQCRRPGRDDHDRRGGLLRGVHCGRQPPGSESRPYHRRLALASAGDAGRRCHRFGAP